MRKLISILLVVLLLVTTIACDPESGTAGNDVTFGATLSVNKAKEITGGDNDVAYVATWKYTAVKSDDGYTTGETTEEKALGDGNLGKLSLGNWTITVNGYDSKDTLIFTGTTEKPEQVVSDGKQIVVNVEPVKDAEVTFYSDFAVAVKAAEACDTITLVKDADVNTQVTLDKNLTLDLGGKTVKLTVTTTGAENQGAFELPDAEAAYSVTVKNGTINGEVSGSKTNAFTIHSNASLTLDGVDIDVKSFRGVQVHQYTSPATLNIKNKSKIKISNGAYAVSTEASKSKGDVSSEIVINIDSSTLETVGDDQDNTALLANVYSKITITDSTLSGQRQGAIIRGTGTETVTIKNSTIEATGDGTKSYTDRSSSWSVGNEVALAALVIGDAKTTETTSYDRATTVKLEDVTLSIKNNTEGGYKGEHIWVTQNSEDYKVTVSGNIKVGEGVTLKNNNKTSLNGATVTGLTCNGKAITWATEE